MTEETKPALPDGDPSERAPYRSTETETRRRKRRRKYVLTNRVKKTPKVMVWSESDGVGWTYALGLIPSISDRERAKKRLREVNNRAIERKGSRKAELSAVKKEDTIDLTGDQEYDLESPPL